MKKLTPIIVLTLLAPVAAAQFISNPRVFGSGRIVSEARSATDFDSDVDTFDYQFGGFQNFTDFISASSTLPDEAQSYGDNFQSNVFDVDEDGITFRTTTCLSASGSAQVPGESDIPNRSNADSSGSMVMLFTVQKPVELTLRGDIFANAFGWSDSLVQVFIYNNSGVLLHAAVTARRDEVNSLSLDESFALEPGNVTIELISFGRMQTVANRDGTGTLNGSATTTWLLEGEINPIRPKVSAGR